MRAKLVVIGGGEMLARIRGLAGPTVTVLGPRPFAELRHYYARCQALIFPGEEDFGMVPVEAMASGRPVIAYGRGGATETVVPYLSGSLFDETVDDLADAVARLENMELDSQEIARHARGFGRARFASQMQVAIDAAFEDKGMQVTNPVRLPLSNVRELAAGGQSPPKSSPGGRTRLEVGANG
jgi:glycosyltransferase involved in cell wall biosynthesis